jgi:hypothetical protein
VFGVGTRPEPVPVFDKVVFFKALQRWTPASLGHIDSVNDFSLAKRLVGVVEEEPIHRTLGGVRREIGARRSILVDRAKLVF